LNVPHDFDDPITLDDRLPGCANPQVASANSRQSTLEFIRRSVLDAGAESRHDPRPVSLRVAGGAALDVCRRSRFHLCHIQVMYAIGLRRPEDPLMLDIPFPSADLGDALGRIEQVFAACLLYQAFLQLVCAFTYL